MISYHFKRLWLLITLFLGFVTSLTKVVVPSVYLEWNAGRPAWTSESFQNDYDYSIFLYQKTNSSAPNYIRTNRGAEGGVYLRYIVDHYHNFPDFAIFVHAAPEMHQRKYNWLDMVKCIRPRATYVSLNSELLRRQPSDWYGIELFNFYNQDTDRNIHTMHMEQCWRDVLKLAWGYRYNNITEREMFMKRVPKTKPIEISAPCCQQFILSRSIVLARPLETWKKLLSIIAVDDACHRGDPQYSTLYTYAKSKEKVTRNEHSGTSNDGNKTGRFIQGGTMEALAHVVFGLQPLMVGMPSNKEYCKHFYEQSVCTGSPCV